MVTLQNKLYVPALAYKQISISQRISDGYRFISDSNENSPPFGLIGLLHKSAIYVKMLGREVNSLFQAMVTIYNRTVHIVPEVGNVHTVSEGNSFLRHERLDNSGHDTLNECSSRLYGISEHDMKIHPGSGKACVLSKARSALRNLDLKTWRDRISTRAVDRIHTDVIGPMKVQPLRNARYFVTTLDAHMHTHRLYSYT